MRYLIINKKWTFIYCLFKEKPLLLVDMFFFLHLRIDFHVELLVVLVVGRLHHHLFIQYTFLICLCFCPYYILFFARLSFRDVHLILNGKVSIGRSSKHFSLLERERAGELFVGYHLLLDLLFALFVDKWTQSRNNEALLLMFNYNKRSIVVEIIANMINYVKYSGGDRHYAIEEVICSILICLIFSTK